MGTRQGCPISLLSLNIILEVLSSAVRPRKKKNVHRLGWKKLFTDDMIVYIENLKESIKENPFRDNN